MYVDESIFENFVSLKKFGSIYVHKSGWLATFAFDMMIANQSFMRFFFERDGEHSFHHVSNSII